MSFYIVTELRGKCMVTNKRELRQHMKWMYELKRYRSMGKSEQDFPTGRWKMTGGWGGELYSSAGLLRAKIRVVPPMQECTLSLIIFN